MRTRAVDFSCSDPVLSEEWASRFLAADLETLAGRVLWFLDPAAPESGQTLDIAPLVAPLRTVLGIAAEEPGFTCVRIAPHPGDVSWAQGWITIPEGLVSVAWQCRDHRFVLDVSIPVGVHLKAVLPARPTDALYVDSEPVDPDSQTIRTAHHVELAVLPGSDYRFEVGPILPDV